ncbi:MAG: hypothetical protein V1894_03020 [Chloroflexota bacterium]
MPKSHSKKRSFPKKKMAVSPVTAAKSETVKASLVTGTSSLAVKASLPLSYPYLGRELVRIAIVGGVVLVLLVILAFVLS